MKHKIAISMRVVQADNYFEPRDAVSHDWIRFFSKNDICPILVPNVLTDPSSFLDSFQRIDGIFLTGGNDTGINESQDISEERDKCEQELVAYALKNNVPVLGICRGLQFLNVYFGGRVVPIVNDAVRKKHVNSSHLIKWVGEMTPVFGEGNCHFQINSFHKNAVTLTNLAPDFIPLAVSENDIVESMKHLKFPIWAIQWHPERSGSNRQLDAWFLEKILNQ